MNLEMKSRLPGILDRNERTILAEWTQQQTDDHSASSSRVNASEMREKSRDILRALREAVKNGDLQNIKGPQWAEVRDQLTEISQTQAKAGATPSETARFVFSLKQALFSVLRVEFASDPEVLAAETWATSTLMDSLGLFTTEINQKTREEVIARQQQELMELSTPVVKMWDGILALPLIGTLDSERTQVVMESLLEQIVDTGASIAIMDITGVPAVDTLVAQHLLKTIAAARLMGADCIISGIRPQIAATIVHLGVDLGNVITKSTLADAFALALRRLGLCVTRARHTERLAEEHDGTHSDT